MTEHVGLYIGERTENVNEKDFFKRVSFVDAEPTDAPADIPRDYSVLVTVESRGGERYEIEIDSQTVNNWLTQFKQILRRELKSEDGYEGEYQGKERNALIIEILMHTVSSWINTNKAQKV